MAASTVRQAHVVIGGALSAAVRWGWIATNPARRAERPRQAARPAARHGLHRQSRVDRMGPQRGTAGAAAGPHRHRYRRQPVATSSAASTPRTLARARGQPELHRLRAGRHPRGCHRRRAHRGLRMAVGVPVRWRRHPGRDPAGRALPTRIAGLPARSPTPSGAGTSQRPRPQAGPPTARWIARTNRDVHAYREHVHPAPRPRPAARDAPAVGIVPAGDGRVLLRHQLDPHPARASRALGHPRSPLTIAFAFAAIIGVFVNGCVAGLYALAAVAYDTGVRATGVGTAIGIGRIGAILSPTVAGALLDNGWTPTSL